MSVLLIQSHYQAANNMGGASFARAIAAGKVRPLREIELDEHAFAKASGLITTTHLDQIGFLRFADGLRAMLDRGGRWFFNGHFLRPPLDGLGVYVPLAARRRIDFAQARLCEHPIFAGIDQALLETNRGVAGFYGRGHNLPPEGARGVNGLGPDRVPVDWVWERPGGGAVFSHAGNDLWGCGDDAAIKARLAERVVAWTAGELQA